jgi:hypothetical protein
VEANGAGHHGSSTIGTADRQREPPPERVRDLAEACVRFVKQKLGVELDYEPETLSILDHYLAGARAAAADKPAAGALVAHAAGAYFGEVVRRRYPSWWRLDGDDPSGWRLELEPVYLSFSPVQLVADALLFREEDPEASERFELEEEDRQAVAVRLAELPGVAEDEFYAPSTRLEVIDIAVEAIRARRLGQGGEGDAALGPDDYEPTPS